MSRKKIETPIGTLVAIADQGKLVYCGWDNEQCRPKEKKTTCICPVEGIEQDTEIINNVAIQLQEYFSGKRKIFEIPFKLKGTPFQLKVWEVLVQTEFGNTISYKELARRVGFPDAIRAVAKACGANPISIIIPCHRIVALNGKTGGYTGGIDKKLALLNLETSFF